MPDKSCTTCGYHKLNPQQCPLIGYQYAPDRNSVCPYWADELPICDHCGKVSPTANVFTQTSDGSWKRLCSVCLSLSGTCGGCTFGTECDFETNPSPTPKTVQKRIQQGNGIYVVTEKNAKRVEETCRKNCQCFDPDSNSCNKENNCCGKYNPIDF